MGWYTLQANLVTPLIAPTNHIIYFMGDTQLSPRRWGRRGMRGLRRAQPPNRPWSSAT